MVICQTELLEKTVEKPDNWGSPLGLTFVFSSLVYKPVCECVLFPQTFACPARAMLLLKQGRHKKFTGPGDNVFTDCVGTLCKLYYRGPGTMFLLVAPLVRCIRPAVLKHCLDGDQQQVKWWVETNKGRVSQGTIYGNPFSKSCSGLHSFISSSLSFVQRV